MMFRVARYIAALLLLFAFTVKGSSMAADPHGDEGDFNDHVSEFIIHHVSDDYKWHVMGSFNLYFPFIAFNYATRSFDIFSSKHLFAGPYQGYILDHGKVTRPDGVSFFDFSITKNVFALFFSAALIILIFTSIARSYRKRDDMVPRGFQSLMEPVILFVRDDIVRPSIGEKKSDKYLPYLLTLFFFILINNLLGLVPLFPGGANLSGNISTTMTLALLTLLVILFSGNKHYWKHIFWPPGVPIPLKIPIAAIEIIGVFTKPFALMIRLFANITAGHIIILSILSLTFIFRSFAVGVGSSLFALFMNLIELLVALLQAYIFTMLSAIFIGQAVEEPEHH